ncbi:hypothetical protein TOI97_09610 [Denitrificimonas sp. JX-1]|uniref:Transposase n=1 Tax=Denitrificimonas halotolerans TaxID=3098930 RepID=A0ABU5GS53_9GAMM|nr:hypothetical protein [Denitrificimonas sp. JX-1]MDY7219815.1 hypothetical protein [Denitrificimonas sp. JX-1]
MARSVNFVWNFVNELSQRSIKERGMFLSAYDMHPTQRAQVKSLGCTVKPDTRQYRCSSMEKRAGLP